MKVRIVNIGDELLIGQVVNSNAAFMCEHLLKNGFFVEKTIVVGDERNAIYQEIEDAFAHVDAVILTGGLGPTKDDITKKVICEYFHTQLILDQDTLDFVSNWLKGRGVTMSETNKTQAMVPETGIILPNRCGTAPGIWMEKEGKVLISLPGVPFEMESLMDREVIPHLQQRFHPNEHYLCKVVQTIGIGESTLSDLLEPWELKLPPHIGLAYLPDSGIIRLRLTGCSSDLERLEKEMEAEVDKLKKLATPYIYTLKDEKMQHLVSELLKSRHQTLSMAESCTGGYMAHLITSIPGSSTFFKGSVVSYANEIKERVLNVSSESIETEGVVSARVVEQMAENVRTMFHTDYAVATSGIAGPEGGTPENPVGTVWVAVSSSSRTISERFSFGNAGGRSRVIYRAAIRALNLLRQEILK